MPVTVPLNVGDILELKVFCAFGNQLAVNVCHYDVTAITGAPTQGAAATYFDDNLFTPYINMISDESSYRGITLAVLLPSPKAPVIRANNTLIGLNGGDALPKQVSGLISLRSELVGRSGRGRVYIPFPTEALNDVTGTPSAAYLTALDAVALVLGTVQSNDQGSGDTVEMTPSIFHRATGTSTLVNGYILRPFWATQRRRGDFGRINTIPF